MVDRRRGEQGPFAKFRSDRFFHDNGKWYFQAREGNVEGPYHSRSEAETRLNEYIRIVSSGFYSPKSGLSIEELK